MKTLYVLRHAKSDWGDSSLRDFDRPLNERGWKAAKSMGREMRARGLAPDLVLVSPAARTTETLVRVEEGFGGKFETLEERSIYLAETETLLGLVRGAPAESDRLMIVGHNPGMHELVLVLSQGPQEVRANAAENFRRPLWRRSASMCRDWADVTTGAG